MLEKTMRSIAAVPVTFLVAAGCMPSRLQETQNELRLCQSARSSSEHQVERMQDGLQGLNKEVLELRRVLEAAKSFTEAELEGVEEQFRDIQVTIPDHVQEEVGGRFDVVRVLIKDKFEGLNRQLTELNQQLGDTDGRVVAIQSQMADLDGLRASLATSCGDLVQQIRDWDGRNLCKGCDLKIKDPKKRELISEHHQQLIDGINNLKTQLLLEQSSAPDESAVGN